MLENLVDWMGWTTPTAIALAALATLLVAMTAWEIAAPNEPRRGLIGLTTTRGDRLFFGLLTVALGLLAWLATTDLALWLTVAPAALWLILVLRYG